MPPCPAMFKYGHNYLAFIYILSAISTWASQGSRTSHQVSITFLLYCLSAVTVRPAPAQCSGQGKLRRVDNGSSPATICFHLPAQHLIKYPTKSHALPINIQQKVVTYRYQDVEWRYGLCNPSNLIFIMLI